MDEVDGLLVEANYPIDQPADSRDSSSSSALGTATATPANEVGSATPIDEPATLTAQGLRVTLLQRFRDQPEDAQCRLPEMSDDQLDLLASIMQEMVEANTAAQMKKVEEKVLQDKKRREKEMADDSRYRLNVIDIGKRACQVIQSRLQISKTTSAKGYVRVHHSESIFLHALLSLTPVRFQWSPILIEQARRKGIIKANEQNYLVDEEGNSIPLEVADQFADDRHFDRMARQALQLVNLLNSARRTDHLVG